MNDDQVTDMLRRAVANDFAVTFTADQQRHVLKLVETGWQQQDVIAALRAEVARLTKRADLAESRAKLFATTADEQSERADAAESKLTDRTAEIQRSQFRSNEFQARMQLAQAPPSTEAWQKLVHLAGIEGSGADFIYQITHSYNEMQKEQKSSEAKLAQLYRELGCELAGHDAALTVIAAKNKACEDLEAVDEVLIVNFVGPRKDGDYRKALHDLVTKVIMEHDDPAVSEVAAKRQALLAKLIPDRLEEMAEKVSEPLLWPEHWGNVIASELRDIAAAVRGMGK